MCILFSLQLSFIFYIFDLLLTAIPNSFIIHISIKSTINSPYINFKPVVSLFLLLKYYVNKQVLKVYIFAILKLILKYFTL